MQYLGCSFQYLATGAAGATSLSLTPVLRQISVETLLQGETGLEINNFEIYSSKCLRLDLSKFGRIYFSPQRPYSIVGVWKDT